MVPKSHFAQTSAASPAPQGKLSPPCGLGDWWLERLAGEGALARVYRARRLESPVAGSSPESQSDDEPGDWVAVKVLRKRWEDRPQAVSMLIREMEVARQVADPHLISVLDVQLAEPPYFVVMPWLGGATLESQVTKSRRPTVPLALWYARQVAQALAALHARQWMHADVKPGNIFVSQTGHVTLIDLGFARKTGEVSATARRQVVGTVNYIAPEMITSALAPDIRSDLYSLGVTLYEMLCGQVPFAGKDLAEIALQHRQATPRDLRCLSPQLPRALCDLVHELLAKEPLRRPQTPAALIHRLAMLEIETFGDRWMESLAA